MQALLKMFDETPGQPRREAGTLKLVSEKVTVRELIRRRIETEVAKYNRSPSNPFRGLVQPTKRESTVNGYERSKLDAEEQICVAIDAFESKRFLLLFNDRQLNELDDLIAIGDNANEDALTFITLIPLKGG